MATKREIENLFCIFNLSVCSPLQLNQPISTRVLFIYDKKRNKKEVRILHKGITEEARSRLVSWVEDNVEVDDIRNNILSSEEINIDEFKKASNF